MIHSDKINKSYTLVEEFRNIKISNELKSLVDIEKYVHRWVLGKISPHEFVILAYCFPTLIEIINKVEERSSYNFDLKEQFMTFNEEVKKTFHFDQLEKYNLLTNIEGNLFKKSIAPQLDSLQNKMDNVLKNVDNMLYALNKCDKSEKKQAVIRFEKTANNDAWYFSTTNKRVESLKKANGLKNWNIRNQKSNVRLFHDVLDSYRVEYLDLLSEMIENVKKEFIKTLGNWENKYGSMMKSLVTYIGYVDFYNNGAYLVDYYGYNRPKIVEKDESFIKSKNMRHPIIEKLDNQISYVPNDVNIPEKNNPGMLLFGLNGGGKSSYMKAVGLNVILAQIGYWVPCESFEFCPFHNLFTRISGDDNIMKGLSSFGVEMKELRNILQKSNEKSLVLGDEICKGTEQDSALGIVAASLITLTQRNKARFIFATHLHALSKQEEVYSKVNIYHLSVECNDDTIIYHRKLLPGSGPSLYGLKVAKYLLHDESVIKLAEELRPKPNEELKESKYNTKVLVEKCEICGVKSDLDVHHIEFQCEANEFDLVQNGKHKNSKSNLVVLCKHHHQCVHQDKIQINGWKETSNGITLDYKETVPKPKVKECKYDDKQISIIQSYKESKLLKKTIVLKLKQEHNICICATTLNKYWS